VAVALIGCGRWGRRIRHELIQLGAEVVVADPVAEEATVGSVAELPEVEAIVVATPATSHAAVLDDVLDRGVPIFCEKPFTTVGADARRLAEAAGDRIHVMHVWRYHPGVELLGRLARDGTLGAVHGVRSTRTNWTSPRRDTDAVWTLVPHDLTIAIEVLGTLPVPRAATVEELGGRAVGLWGLCGAPGEPWLVIEASTRFADRRREVRVHGEDGVAVLPTDEATALRIERGAGLEPEVEEVRFDPEPPLRRELAAFLGHVAGGPPPKSPAAEGVAVVEAVEALRRQAGRSG
jgi:predicted dehydrogenase